MARYIPRERWTEVEYYHHWHYANDSGSGYSIPCTEDGKLLNPSKDTPIYDDVMARSQTDELVYDGIQRMESVRYSDPELVCECGERFILASADTNRCPRCGRYYNGFGQELRPPSQWDDLGEYLL